MAKSDLLKEAIADAKAVKATALANAKIALQEAFAPRIQSMLSAKLSEDLYSEQEEEIELGDDELAGEEMPVDDMGAMDDMGGEGEPMGDEMPIDGEGEPMDVGDIEIDTDMDGEIDFTGDIMSKPGMEAEPEMGDEMGDEMPIDGMEPELEPGMEDEMDGEMSAELGIEEIIRELEEDMDGDDSYAEGTDEVYLPEETPYANESIDSIIEAILAEDDPSGKYANTVGERVPSTSINEVELEEDETNEENIKEELDEAYRTVKHLKSVINEVNLLNAKLLYTNKLFRNFELNEAQKMKVIENFDRAANTREAKLVFTTLAESFHTPKGKRKIVKESRSMASKPVATTAPSKKTTQVLTEGQELANRWKKLAGLIK